MSLSRRRLRAFLIGAGIFVALLGCAAILVHVGRPSTQAPPASSSPSVSTGQPGPNEDGAPAPTAEAQDTEGAVAAALSYAAAPQAWLYLSDGEIRSAIAAITTPNAAHRIANDVVQEVGASRSELAEAAGPVWWIVHPLAWRVDKFRQTEATISVWTFSLLSAADVAIPQTEWTTTTLDLEWVSGGWRIASVSDTLGPTPSIGPDDQPWEPEPLDDALQGFTRLSWDDGR